ncbi:MAG: hypothetical protein AAF577_16765 [Pseudomonadota bacterium]
MSEFSAWINLQPPGPSKLIVIGKVVTNGGNLVPRLTERVPQGINPTILLLDLRIEDTGGVGTTDVAPRDVRFEKAAGKGAYTSVEIYANGDLCQKTTVDEAH